MAVVTGQRTTENVAAAQRFIDIAKPILLLEPSATPLVKITKSIEKSGRVVKAQDPEFAWMEDALESRFDAVNNGGGYSDSATSIVVDTGDVFYGAALVKVPRTDEIMYVSSVSTNTLTVIRGYAGTTNQALNDNEPLFVLGSVSEEGDTSLSARTENPVKVTNYTQIFRTSIEETGTALSSANMTSPHDWVHQNKKKMIEHLKSIEHAFLFGAPNETTGPNGKPLRTTGGLLHYFTENNQDAGGTLTEIEFETFLRSIFRYGGDKKTLFCSPLLVSVLNNFSAGKLQTAVGAESYGVKVMNWHSAHGEVSLVKHNLLEGAVWGGYGIAVDFKVGEFKYRPLGGSGTLGGSRDTKVLPNRQANDLDGRKDEVLTEAGIQAALPKAHGVLTGVTG